MDYRVLGPLEVLDESGQRVFLGGAMQQSVLASLLLRAGQTVALDRLVDELWDEPPATATRTVQAYISRLRHELPDGAIERRAGGYAVVLGGDDLDLGTFEQGAGEGRAALAAADYERAASVLGRALALWRGPALAGLTSEALRREADRLEEERLGVLEDRIDADLGAGRHAEVSAELTARVGELEAREKRHGKGKLRQSSVENILKPLRAVLAYAVKEKLLSASPFAALEKEDRPAEDEEPHEPHQWTDAELELLLAASRRRAAERASRYDYSPLLTVAAKAGLRLGELLGLEWPDCELVRGGGALNIRRQWTRLRETAPPKAGSRRRVPISDELVLLLLELKMAAPDKGEPVFASRTGSRLSHRNVERRGFHAAAEDAGIEDVTLHDLRHAYGSRLASRGLSAKQIAEAMGHKRTATTEIYIQRFSGDQADERVREAMSG